ncbi:MAG: putative tubulin-tyrosine ligase family protein [Streblomastix strix]|uniref:Putative tubulin-tyrosine ligase family protein n=1 Tax=Streblomastix strix TaxID=222440 RepID=A0A5J4WH82_9EUKA|nr:MAG: putative tubulin-tyrosine ligase family protein [Streblomastix strix]
MDTQTEINNSPSPLRIEKTMKEVAGSKSKQQSSKKQKAKNRFRIHNKGDCMEDVRKALEDRAWTECKDPDYDFGWAIKAKELLWNEINSVQIVNHFQCSTSITTKGGLYHSLKSNAGWEGINHSKFFPLCFDLRDRDEKKDFVSTFRLGKCLRILRQFVRENDKEIIEKKKNQKGLKPIKCTRYSQSVVHKALLYSEAFIHNQWEWAQESDDKEESEINKEYKVIEIDKLENNQQLGNIKLDQSLYQYSAAVCQRMTEDDWNEIGNDCVERISSITQGLKQQSKSLYSSHTPSTLPIPSISELIQRSKQAIQVLLIPKIAPNIQSLEKLGHKKNVWIVKPVGKSRGRGIECFSSLNKIMQYIKTGEDNYIVQKYIEKPLLIHGHKFDIRLWVLVTSLTPLTIWRWKRPYFRLSSLPYTLDSLDKIVHLTNNIVQVESSMFGCLDADEAPEDKNDDKQKEKEKEKENKKKKKKFGDSNQIDKDIIEDDDDDDDDDNVTVVQAVKGIEGCEGNMWHLRHFEKYLHELEIGKIKDEDMMARAKALIRKNFNEKEINNQKNNNQSSSSSSSSSSSQSQTISSPQQQLFPYHTLWNTSTWPQIKDIINSAIKCGRDGIRERKASFEIYGFDFMIDENMKPWLIEINSSPCMAHSTPIVTDLIQSAVNDTLKVLFKINK